MVTENIDIKVNVLGNLQKLQKDLIGVQRNLRNMNRSTNNVSQAYENLQRGVKGYTDTLKMANKVSVKSLFNNKKVDKFKQNIDSLYASAKKASKPVNVLTKDVKEFNATLKQANKTAISGMFKKPTEGAKKFRKSIEENTNALLSLLFLGIWLQQVMTGAMKSIFEGYKKALPQGHKFNRMTNKLSANWEYFKFQIADALANSTLFQKFIEFLLGILKKLQSLSPEAKVFLGVMIAVLATLGGIFFLFGQIFLGSQGILMMASGIATAYAFVKKAIISTYGPLMVMRAKTYLLAAASWAATAPWWAILAVIGLVAAAGLALYKLNETHLNDMGLEVSGVWNNIKSITITFLAGLANLFVTAVAGIINIFIGLGTAIKAAFDSIIEMAKQLGQAIWSAIKAGFTGGDPLKEFKENFDTDSIKSAFKDTMSDGIGVMSDVTEGANAITKSINNWEYDKQIEWANATTTAKDNMDDMAKSSKEIGKNLDIINQKDISNMIGDAPSNMGSNQSNNNTYYIDGVQIDSGSDLGKSTNDFIQNMQDELEIDKGSNTQG